MMANCLTLRIIDVASGFNLSIFFFYYHVSTSECYTHQHNNKKSSTIYRWSLALYLYFFCFRNEQNCERPIFDVMKRGPFSVRVVTIFVPYIFLIVVLCELSSFSRCILWYILVFQYNLLNDDKMKFKSVPRFMISNNQLVVNKNSFYQNFITMILYEYPGRKNR